MTIVIVLLFLMKLSAIFFDDRCVHIFCDILEQNNTLFGCTIAPTARIYSRILIPSIELNIMAWSFFGLMGCDAADAWFLTVGVKLIDCEDVELTEVMWSVIIYR